MKNFLLVSICLYSAVASAFNPVFLQTDNYKIKTSQLFSRHNNPTFCKFETRLNEKKQVIEIRAGVVGSPVDFFGWNMSIELNEFPLKAGLKKVFKTPGVTGMILSYDGKTLEFKKLDNEQVWNRLYNFKVVVDENLEKVKTFQGTMEGFERTTFGNLKKHVVTNCKF